MSVDKLVITKYNTGYTSINNDILQQIDDIEVLGLYCYLSSLPPNFFIYRNQVRSHFRLGIHKIAKLLKELEKYDLVKTTYKRDENGRFTYMNIDVKMLQFGQVLEKKDNLSQDLSVDNFVQEEIKDLPDNVHRSTDSVTRCDKTPYIYIKKEINNIYTFFEKFKNLYLRKEAMHKAKQIWIRDKLEDKGQEIINALQKQNECKYKNKDIEFVPMATTWLNQRRYEDAIVDMASKNFIEQSYDIPKQTYWESEKSSQKVVNERLNRLCEVTHKDALSLPIADQVDRMKALGDRAEKKRLASLAEMSDEDAKDLDLYTMQTRIKLLAQSKNVCT